MKSVSSSSRFCEKRMSRLKKKKKKKKRKLGWKNILHVMLKILDIFSGKNLYVSINESKTKEVIRGDKNRQLIVL